MDVTTGPALFGEEQHQSSLLGHARHGVGGQSPAAPGQPWALSHVTLWVCAAHGRGHRLLQGFWGGGSRGEDRTTHMRAPGGAQWLAKGTLPWETAPGPKPARAAPKNATPRDRTVWEHSQAQPRSGIFPSSPALAAGPSSGPKARRPTPLPDREGPDSARHSAEEGSVPPSQSRTPLPRPVPSGARTAAPAPWHSSCRQGFNRRAPARPA